MLPGNRCIRILFASGGKNEGGVCVRVSVLLSETVASNTKGLEAEFGEMHKRLTKTIKKHTYEEYI